MKIRTVIFSLLIASLSVLQGGCRSGTWFPKNNPERSQTHWDAKRDLRQEVACPGFMDSWEKPNAPGHIYDADRRRVRKDKR